MADFLRACVLRFNIGSRRRQATANASDHRERTILTIEEWRIAVAQDHVAYETRLPWTAHGGTIHT
jgi:hypothetical protein